MTFTVYSWTQAAGTTLFFFLAGFGVVVGVSCGKWLMRKTKVQ